jgi:CheY-like chemotaxis protein
MIFTSERAPQEYHCPAVAVVEDEIFIRIMISEDLRAAGFQVFEAKNADDALAILQSKTHLDLIISDVRMPGEFDGLKLAEHVRSDWPHVKIILVSAHIAVPPPTSLVDAFFEKPYDSMGILEAARQLLSMRDL